jgi:hypothetical protein
MDGSFADGALKRGIDAVLTEGEVATGQDKMRGGDRMTVQAHLDSFSLLLRVLRQA